LVEDLWEDVSKRTTKVNYMHRLLKVPNTPRSAKGGKFLTFLVVLVLLVAQLAVLEFVPSVEAQNPSTIATLPSGTPALRRIPQRKIFRCGSIYFTFFSDGTNMVYYTSSDGVSWTSHPAVVACTSGEYFSIRHYSISGTDYVYYARLASDSSYWYIYFRRGTISGDTITWGTEYIAYQDSISIYIGIPDVEVTTDNYVWVSFSYRSTYVRTKIYTNANNDGSGTWSSSTYIQFGYNIPYDAVSCLVRLTNGKLYVITYNPGATIGVLGKLLNVTWGAVETITDPGYPNIGAYWSAAPGNDNVYFVSINGAGSAVQFKLRTYGVGWGSFETVDTSLIENTYEICVDNASGDCYVFTFQAAGAGYNDLWYYKRTSGVWGSHIILFTSENNPITGTVNSYINVDSANNEIGLAWDDGPPGVATYVRFGIFSTVADTTPPTYSDIATNTTVAGQPCQFQTLWNDNVNVSGYIFGTNNTGAWVNDTWASFTVFYNSTAAWSNVTKTLNSTVGARVEWQIWANDTSNNWNNTGTQYLITTSVGYQLNLHVLDYDLADSIASANVFIKNDTNSYIQTSDANGWANWTGVSGTVYINASYYGFWVNGTFSTSVSSDTTLNIRCNLYDVYVQVLPANQQGILYTANVTVFNSTSLEANKICTALSNETGYAYLPNLPNNTLTFTVYAKSDYSLVIANVTQQLFEHCNTGDNAYVVVHQTAWKAQTFTPATAHVIKAVKLKLSKLGNPTTPIDVSIKATDSNGKPTGSDFCHGTLDPADIPSAPDGDPGAWYVISLGVGYSLVADTKYAIVVHMNGGDSSNEIQWRLNTLAPYAGGAMCYSADGTTWYTGSGDCMFEEYSSITTPTSDEEVLTPIICDQNYGSVSIPWELIMVPVSAILQKKLKNKTKKRLSHARVSTNRPYNPDFLFRTFSN